jgi:hypothetical protein
MQAAVAKARILGHPLTIAYVLRHYAVFAALRKNYLLVVTLCNELTEVCLKYQIRQWSNLGPLLTAWSRFWLRQDNYAVPALLNSLAQHRNTGFRRNMPFYLAIVADVLASAGRVDQARGLIVEANTLLQELDEVWFQPHLLEVAERVNALPASKS